MSKRIPFYAFIVILVTIGLATSFSRHFNDGIPWLPDNNRELWEIEARIDFVADPDYPVHVSLALPELKQPGFTLISESSSANNFGLNYHTSDLSRRLEWSKRDASGEQTLFYRAQFLVEANSWETSMPVASDRQPRLTFVGPERLAANAIRETAQSKSSNDVNFALELIKSLGDNNENAALLTSQYPLLDIMSTILSEANIPNRQVAALSLEDGRRRQAAQLVLQIWTGSEWLNYDPAFETLTPPGELLVWDALGVSLLDVSGGRGSRVNFSMISQEVTPQEAARSIMDANQPFDLSIHSLPLEEQAMFKTIMLIPIGALIVVILRIFVGLKTSGTFMPVLIAMAFVQTQLMTGIIGLVVIVSIGLIIRGYLSKLNLLLVARISAVIITVILLIAMLAVLAFRLELTAGLSITFFPMIILAWTIERMSIIWEEDGWNEVLKQASGSLITAVIVYFAMTNDVIRYWSFNFIGLQLIVLALILMIGNYTGYRLSELIRFKPLESEDR